MPNFIEMKTEKEKLEAKSVAQLQAYAKKIGANIKDPKTGKLKTKIQLVNSIVMLQRLGKAKKQISAVVKKQTSKKTAAESRQTKMKGRDIARDLDRSAKVPGKRTSASGRTYYERRANRSDVRGTMLGSKIKTLVIDNGRMTAEEAIKVVNHKGPVSWKPTVHNKKAVKNQIDSILKKLRAEYNATVKPIK